MKLGLDNIRELLSILGNPQEKWEAIHVAGSNGKGSVSAMLAAALQANGYKAGLYTSPHLVDFRERIKINGEPVSAEYISSFLKKNWKEVERLRATFFEVVTALAFAYYSENNVQVAVIETGLGGRLDATNVLMKPLASVITSISLEHTAQLGNTLQEIASEKAGIMKQGIPAIVNVAPDLYEVFLAKAGDIGASVIFSPDFVRPEEYKKLDAPFSGVHQEQNLQTEIATLENVGIPLNKELTMQGISFTRKLTGIRARMEDYSYSPLEHKNLRLFLDVAHNPDAFRFLGDYFLRKQIRPIVIAGFARDKDINSILHYISGFASKFIAVAADSHRDIPAEELANLSRSVGIATSSASSPRNGVDAAISLAKGGEVLLLTGSHFVVGDFLKVAES